MRNIALVVAAAAAFAAVPAAAQDMSAPADTTATQTDAPTADAAPGAAAAPDGSKFFGFVPYVGVLGGYDHYDNEGNRAGIPQALNPNGTRRNDYKLAGGLVEGVVGANLPVGPGFVGVEGTVAKGFTGNVDWEYGAFGRFGFRAGDSGLFYGKVGYEWVNFDHFAGDSKVGTGRDYNDIDYGIGFEVGPKDIGLKGLTNNAGFRLRGEVTTLGNFHSIRPMLGVITHF